MSQENLVDGVRGPLVSKTYNCCPTEAWAHKPRCAPSLRAVTGLTSDTHSPDKGCGMWTRCDVDTQSVNKKRYAGTAKSARWRRSFGMQILRTASMGCRTMFARGALSRHTVSEGREAKADIRPREGEPWRLGWELGLFWLG